MDFFNKLVYGRQDYSPSSKQVLQQVGNNRIVKARIRRHPISQLITGSFKVIKLYRQENMQYDQLFHLAIIFELDNGRNVLVEKNEVINITLQYTDQKGSEYCDDVPIITYVTLSQALDRTKSFMGGKFFPYSAYDNNCQVFIASILRANGWANQTNLSFVEQDTKSLFANNSFLRKFANTTTDIAGRFDVLRQGGSLKNYGMTGQQIDNILKSKCNGIYMKDDLPKQLNDGWYVVNMDSHTGQGTHWCAFKYSSTTPSVWFDSFGIIPPLDVLDSVKQNLIYNNEQIQDINSSCCGWFSIACILYDNPMIPAEQSLNRFIHMFSKNTLLNDDILNKILMKKNIHLQ